MFENEIEMTNLDGLDGLDMELALRAQDMIDSLIQDEGLSPFAAIIFACKNPPCDMFGESDLNIGWDTFFSFWVKNVVLYCQQFQNF